jgi:hypothetical protein
MKIRSLVASVMLALVMMFGGTPAEASSHRGSKPRTHAAKTTPAGKTVHVRSYTKRDGTHVTAHNRRPPSSHATAKAKRSRKT